MSKRYNIVLAHKYTTRGEEKTEWIRIGSMFENERGEGFTIRLRAIPCASTNGEIVVHAFPPKERNQGSGSGGGEPSW